MARFKLFLIGTPSPLDVDLPVSSVTELNEIASRARFIQGNMAEPDHEGVCPGVLIPTSRLHMVIEAD
jgi:hypothetical protein